MTEKQILDRKVIAVRLRCVARNLQAAADAIEVSADVQAQLEIADAHTQLRYAIDEYEAVDVTATVGAA